MANKKKAVPSREYPRIYYAFALTLPLVLLFLVEIGLRLIDYGGSLDLFLRSERNGEAVYVINKNVGQKYFSGRDIAIPDPYDETFPVRKDPGALRIFCLGASTTVGFPYDFNATFPSYLRDRLQATFPEKKFEVINLGMAAIMSHTVLDFARQALRMHPDALLVYMGHNEFYGALGSASTMQIGAAGARWMVKLYLRLQGSRLFRLLRNGLTWVQDMLAGNRKGDAGRRKNLMEVLARESAIPAHSELYARTVATFRANLQEIVALAQARNTPIVVGTLVSNVKDQPPFVSMYSPATTGPMQRNWVDYYTTAKYALERGDPGAALASLAQAAAIDSLPARLHYLRGQANLAMGRIKAAAANFQKARDLDGLRFRAPSEFNQVIRDVAGESRIPVADIERAFATVSPHGLVGKELLFEHVHPRSPGYFLMAKTFAETLRHSGLLFPPEVWRAHAWPADDSLRALAAVTPLDEEIAAFRIAVLKSGWPFRAGGERKLPEAVDAVAMLAKKVALRQVGWRQGHMQNGKRLARARRYLDAAREYLAVARVSPYFQQAWVDLGNAYGLAEQYERAEWAYRRALHIALSPNIMLRLATLYVTTNELQKARETLRQLVAIPSGDIGKKEKAMAHFLYAGVLAQSGDLAQARVQIEQAAQISPDNPNIRQLQRQLGK